MQRVAPTKANLLRLQGQLKFATEGCELLHQKRDVLVMELMGVVAGFADVEARLQTTLGQSLDAFLDACMVMGSEGVQRAVSAHQPELDLEIEQDRVMGIPLPHVRIVGGAAPALPGLLFSTTSLDDAIRSLPDVVDVLVSHIETVAAIWRLAVEIEKTQRRVHALESIFIPEAEETIRWIRSALEETEREELFRLKLLKGRSA